jgi:hypothetical protein
MTAWLLFIQLGYPSFAYTAIPGIGSQAACRQLANDLKAGEEDGKKFPVWKCVPYLAIER